MHRILKIYSKITFELEIQLLSYSLFQVHHWQQEEMFKQRVKKDSKGKHKGGAKKMEEERATKMLVDNSGTALVIHVKGSSLPLD